MSEDNIWSRHPRWKEVVEICDQIEKLHSKAELIRTQMQKDLFDDESFWKTNSKEKK